MEINKIYQGDCIIEIQKIDSESIDCILTDPPYKYLKNQKLEVDFDEKFFFNEAKRVLKKNGFIVLFGRGTSFYRWNMMLVNLGFIFKEEIIWDKSYSTSPVHPINRTHETISIYTKSKGTLNSVRVPYIEQKSGNIESIIHDVKRIKSALNNEKSFDYLIDYLENNQRNDLTARAGKCGVSNFNTTLQTKALGRQEVNTMVSIKTGMKEKSIIKILREHYSLIHPTQKPVRLLERLIALTTKEGDLVLDPFLGSGSTAISCANTGRNFIGFEIDAEYYKMAVNRIRENSFV